jgi:hypothetical protein
MHWSLIHKTLQVHFACNFACQGGFAELRPKYAQTFPWPRRTSSTTVSDFSVAWLRQQTWAISNMVLHWLQSFTWRRRDRVTLWTRALLLFICTWLQRKKSVHEISFHRFKKVWSFKKTQTQVSLRPHSTLVSKQLFLFLEYKKALLSDLVVSLSLALFLSLSLPPSLVPIFL